MLERLTNRLRLGRGLPPLVAPNGRKHEYPTFYPLPTSGTGWLTSVPGDVTDLTRQTAFAASLYCYAALRYRSQNIAEPPIVLIEKTPDGDQIIDSHPALELLADPSPDFDQGELLEMTTLAWDLDGMALWVMDEDAFGRAAAIQVLGGQEFTVEPSDGRMYGRFRLKVQSGRRVRGPDEVVFFRYPNPSDRWVGLSPTDVALSWLGLGAQVKASVKNLLRNAMFPSVVISTDPEWNPDDDTYERFKAHLEQFYTGERNTGKPFVNLGGGRVDRVSYTLRDLVPAEVLHRVEANVASAYGIAPVILGWQVGLENSPWSQMSEARQFTYEDTLIPLWARYGRALTRQMGFDLGPSLRYGFDLRDVKALQEDEKEKAEIAEKLSNIWTRDELRVYTGQEPHPDPTVGEEIPGRARAPTTPPPQEKTEKKSGSALAWWMGFDITAKATEPMWTRETIAALGEQKAQAEKMFRSTVRPKGKADDDIPDPATLTEFAILFQKWLDDEGNERLRKKLIPLIETSSESAIRRLAAKVGVAFDVLLEGLGDFVNVRSVFLAEKMGETTGGAVTRAMSKAAQEGDLILDIARRLEELPEFDRARAVKVARTETTAVLNGAQRASMSSFQADNPDVQVMKTWLTALDARVRPAHRELHGDQIAIDDTFENGLTEPGEPNCRCTLDYQIAEVL